MTRRHKGQRGFTLLEVMIAGAIAAVIVGGATMAMVNALRSWRASAIHAELHMDLEIAMERIRHDLRLSSVGIGLMAFFPADATEYRAISFPLATPDEHDGLLARDADGRIIWDTTVIYHVRRGSPDELIRSTFHPRNLSASPADFYAQLVQVVNSENITDVHNAAMSGESAASRAIFRNLVNMSFRPPGNIFDGYAPQTERARTWNFGSIVLSNGVHDLSFSVIGRNPDSIGYKLGIDRFSLSYSASPREGEIVLPAHSHPADPYYGYSITDGTVVAQDMSTHGARWSGRSQLTYTPGSGGTPVVGGSRLTFQVGNDLWCDTNFDNPSGTVASNCSRMIARSFTNDPPYIPDIVVGIETGVSWNAGTYAANINDNMPLFICPTSMAEVVTLIHGDIADTNLHATINLNGAWVRFAFYAGTETNALLNVTNITFARSTADGVPLEAPISLHFPTNRTGALLPPRTAGEIPSAYTQWVAYDLVRTNNYRIRYESPPYSATVQLRNRPHPVHPDQWVEVLEGEPGLARFWATSGRVLSYTNGVPVQGIIGIGHMEVLYPVEGIYRSGIFDTRITSGVTYRDLAWTQRVPLDPHRGRIEIRARSSSLPDMSDAPPWYPDGYFQTHQNNDIGPIGNGRYVQYEALFTTSLLDPNTDPVPDVLLRDVTLTWDAPTGIVDLTVDFARGPDYGIVRADVNDQSFIKGVEVFMEIFRDGPHGRERAPGIMEVRPLNTGR